MKRREKEGATEIPPALTNFIFIFQFFAVVIFAVHNTILNLIEQSISTRNRTELLDTERYSNDKKKTWLLEFFLISSKTQGRREMESAYIFDYKRTQSKKSTLRKRETC